MDNVIHAAGETGARNGNTAVHFKSALQQNGVYVPPSTEYDLVGPCPSRKETLEFDNPLYSDTGPVTFTESNLYESVSIVDCLLFLHILHIPSVHVCAHTLQTDFGTSSSAREYTAVPTIVSLHTYALSSLHLWSHLGFSIMNDWFSFLGAM